MDAVNAGDNAFLILSAALVMLMTPGLALFYGGMVRAKNVLGTIMQSFFIVAVVSLLWAIIGYTLAFGPDFGGLIGGLAWLGLNGVGQEPFAGYAATVPHLSFMIFQAMFAVITPALITGAFAERMKFSSFLLFTIAWSLLVYSPVAHWVWGLGGWVRTLGALDFAGGTVVHINAAAAALAAAVVMGRRRGLGTPDLSPHNLPMTVLGAALLWFGWFGFNAGSALTAGGLAASAFVVTHLAAAAATVSWVVVEWLHRGKPTTLGAASGGVAGLVAITPASGFVGPMPAIIIGLLAGAICYGAVLLKWRLGYDDSLDAVGVHGAGGITGALCTGLFASVAVNSAGANGAFYGNPGLFISQLIAVVATLTYSFVVSYVILRLVDGTLGLRLKPDEEESGLDLSQHSESAYTL
ncbi:MAG: ammonium transporter [Chloroflexi bacterium]|nr:ammonium transporter [Chloroflexota bacterium]